MICYGKICLVLVAICFVGVAVADDATASPNSTVTEEDVSFECRSVCGVTDDGEPIALSNPDFVVEYQWNSRVPTCAGKSCQSGPCSEIELRLPSYQTDDAACKEHQAGIQEAGCECSSGGSSSLFGSFPFLIAPTITVGLLNLLL